MKVTQYDIDIMESVIMDLKLIYERSMGLHKVMGPTVIEALEDIRERMINSKE